VGSGAVVLLSFFCSPFSVPEDFASCPLLLTNIVFPSYSFGAVDAAAPVVIKFVPSNAKEVFASAYALALAFAASSSALFFTIFAALAFLSSSFFSV
jgi:hypothetical protein